MTMPVLKRKLSIIACLLLTGLMTGCQCTPLTDHYSDKIDDISEYGFCMDCYYNPCWDLSRIGHSDWKACKMNRAWCGDCKHGAQCESECDSCDACSQTGHCAQ